MHFSGMEIMLDTANLEEIEKALDIFPITGVTSNPTILKALGKVDLYGHLGKVKLLCGNRSLHVQVVSETAEEIIKEADVIRKTLGLNTYIKIPVNKEGLKAIKALSSKGVNITATAVYSSMQGILAVLAGAKYVAVYFNRMENNNSDPSLTIEEISNFIAEGGYIAKVLGASYKNVGQLVKSFNSGARSITVSPDLLYAAVEMASIDKAVADFKVDFETINGSGKTMGNLG